MEPPPLFQGQVTAVTIKNHPEEQVDQEQLETSNIGFVPWTKHPTHEVIGAGSPQLSVSRKVHNTFLINKRQNYRTITWTKTLITQMARSSEPSYNRPKSRDIRLDRSPVRSKQPLQAEFPGTSVLTFNHQMNVWHFLRAYVIS